MCNILYHRFAVLAQFFKLLFSFFYNLKKNRCDFLFVVSSGCFFSHFLYVITYLVMVA